MRGHTNLVECSLRKVHLTFSGKLGVFGILLWSAMPSGSAQSLHAWAAIPRRRSTSCARCSPLWTPTPWLSGAPLPRIVIDWQALLSACTHVRVCTPCLTVRCCRTVPNAHSSSETLPGGSLLFMTPWSDPLVNLLPDIHRSELVRQPNVQAEITPGSAMDTGLVRLMQPHMLQVCLVRARRVCAHLQLGGWGSLAARQRPPQRHWSGTPGGEGIQE